MNNAFQKVLTKSKYITQQPIHFGSEITRHQYAAGWDQRNLYQQSLPNRGVEQDVRV